ncbi:aldo/keto reductase [Campylobacter sp. RM9344]|uniref:Aldo/keto reductase n=1 Tax=Campylobacter californiensis TaxID=1032243 RepID=A0AAW3ZYZ2_9BACT|nr:MULTISPECIES: aldo/keto reductase [unclassified Campylobacter]MBE2984967.1 aldo/keto reductase [Campylobacter sp. RM6883]MBE2986686.1 aldo/keto reductase [Campylobacter sp. RM12919]MBE2989009.1 aldo/keto reductase [Campylobacter sp. RM12920]MBE2995409.1 aldo/keto reductase [Campylobacter sp. RM6913]MBE3030335.1 aldo/keto reductase [Campylobacter sp. RM9344]
MQRREFMKISALGVMAMANVSLFANESVKTLNLGGVNLPFVGLGTWDIRGAEGQKAIESALKLGYRLIDSAVMYGNEEIVGKAVKNSGIKRDEIIVTTKIYTNINKNGVKETLLGSLKRSGLEYFDIYMFHRHGGSRTNEAWEAAVELKKQGLCKHLAVSNFTPEEVRDVCVNFKDEKPLINQILINPFDQKISAGVAHKELGVVLQSFSSFGGSGASVLGEQTIINIAKKHGKTPAQVVLRWLIQREILTIPKSMSEKRQAENLAVFDFTLDANDMSEIAKMDRGQNFYY